MINTEKINNPIYNLTFLEQRKHNWMLLLEKNKWSYLCPSGLHQWVPKSCLSGSADQVKVMPNLGEQTSPTLTIVMFPLPSPTAIQSTSSQQGLDGFDSKSIQIIGTFSLTRTISVQYTSPVSDNLAWYRKPLFVAT